MEIGRNKTANFLGALLAVTLTAAAALSGCATTGGTGRPIHSPPVRTAPELTTADPTSANGGWRENLQLAAILTAVTVFGAREALEWRRRVKSRRRRLAALKAILARECELNHWTIRVLAREITSIKNNFENEGGQTRSEYDVVFRRDGSAILEEKIGGEWAGSRPIPDVHPAGIQARTLDIAELDSDLYAKLDQALSGLSELKHVRDSLISYVLKEDQNMPDLLESFPDYALREIQESSDSLGSLYTSCTGKPLINSRLR